MTQFELHHCWHKHSFLYEMEQQYRTVGYSKDILFVAYEQRNATWIPLNKNKALSTTLERQEWNPQDSVTHLETSNIILQRRNIKFRWNLYIWSCQSQFMTTAQTHRHPVLNNAIQFLSPVEWWTQPTPFQVLSRCCRPGTYLGRTIGMC
jgi:hypothetical protein